MNSELIVKLENLLKKYEGEYNELTDLTHVPSKKDLARMKQIRKEVSTLATDIKEMRKDLNTLKQFDAAIAIFTRLSTIEKDLDIAEENKDLSIYIKEALLQAKEKFENEVINKWSELKEKTEEETTEEKKLKLTNK